MQDPRPEFFSPTGEEDHAGSLLPESTSNGKLTLLAVKQRSRPHIAIPATLEQFIAMLARLSDAELSMRHRQLERVRQRLDRELAS